MDYAVDHIKGGVERVESGEALFGRVCPEKTICSFLCTILVGESNEGKKWTQGLCPALGAGGATEGNRVGAVEDRSKRIGD